MTAIIISSTDRALSQRVGKTTAEALGCAHLDPTLLDRVAERFDVRVDRLRHALDSDSAHRLPADERHLLLAYIQTMTLEAFQRRDVVCSGLAAHLYIRGVSHVLVARLVGDSHDLTERARATDDGALANVDGERRRIERRRVRWCLDNFGIDERDPSIYDLLLGAGQAEWEDRVRIITELAGYRKFQPMTYSLDRLNDLILASRVLVALLPGFPGVNVRVAGTRAVVYTPCSVRAKESTVARIKERVGRVAGFESVEVHAASPARVLPRLVPYGHVA